VLSNAGKDSIIYRLISGLVYSNIFIALQALSIAFVSMALSGLTLKPEPLFISFASFFIVYTFDRYLDRDEDAENMPVRTKFLRKYGEYLFAASIAGYIAALIIAFNNGFITFLLTLSPIIVGVLYSVARIKKILLVKNIVVGLTWGSIPLLVGAYYGSPILPEILFLAAFFGIGLFRNTIVFDIKDIEGDLKEGVRTIPNTYGKRRSRQLALCINAFLTVLLLFSIASNILGVEYLILIFYNIYIFLYCHIVSVDHEELFYSLIVDGACSFLGLSITITSLLGII
jgi:4-hydroxybenzoate polyprenyltransferase